MLLLNPTLAFVGAHLALLVHGASPALPAQLFSPLIPLKVSNTFALLPSPIQYPQYTDTTAGKWILFDPNLWTSGFFPVTGYALNTRLALCGATPANGLGMADWLDLGRSASNGLLDLNASSGIGHDVGFISFPFVEELLVCVLLCGFLVSCLLVWVLGVQEPGEPDGGRCHQPLCDYARGAL